MSEPKRYALMGNPWEMVEHKNGNLVFYEDYARLKAEVAELKSQPDPLTVYLYAAELAKDEVKRLKAEIEKLTFDPMSYLDDQGEWMPRYTHLVAVERLKAEIERLKDEVGLMNQLFEKHMTPEIRKAMVKAVKKGRRS